MLQRDFIIKSLSAYTICLCVVLSGRARSAENASKGECCFANGKHLACVGLQVQALQQAVIKIGEHLSGKGGAGGEQPEGEQKQGAEYDADVKGDKKEEQK